MHESALFWKMKMDEILGAEQGAGKKLDKACITISLACNVIDPTSLSFGLLVKLQYYVVLDSHLLISRISG